MIDGLLLQVIEEPRGSYATDTVPAGGTQIPVNDAGDYVEDGGTLDICGQRIDYTAVETIDQGMDPLDGVPVASGLLTLADPLTAQVDPDDPVLLVLGGEIATDAYAVIDILAGEGLAPDGGDSVLVPIDYTQRAVFPLGVYEPPPSVQLADDLTRILTLPGIRPTIDAEIITNLPEPGGPTEPPATSPTPQPVGNIRTILGSITPVPLATRYDIHLAAITPVEGQPVQPPGSPPDPSTLNVTISASQFQITAGPPVVLDPTTDPPTVTTELQHGTDYWVAAVARNDLGAAPPSPWVGPVRLRQVTNDEVAANFAYIGSLFADQIVGGNLSATVVLSGKFTTRAGEVSEPGGEFDTDGLRGFGSPANVGEPAPLEVRIPFTGDPDDEAYFAGKVAARKLITYEGAEFHGFIDDRGEHVNRVKENAALVLEAGTGSPPSAPQITQTVPSVQLPRPTATFVSPGWPPVTFNPAQCRGLNWDARVGAFMTVQNVGGTAVFWRISPTGEIVNWFVAWRMSDLLHAGILRPDTTREAHLYRIEGQWYLETQVSAIPIALTNPAQVPSIGLGFDGDIRIAETIPGQPAGRLRIRRYSFLYLNPPTLVNTIDTPAGVWTQNTNVGQVHLGGFDFGSGGNHHVFSPYDVPGPVRITGNANPAQTPDYEWNLPTGMVGVCMDAIPGQPATRWYGLGTDGRLYTFGNNTWPNSVASRHVAAITMANSDAESQVSDLTTFALNKRQQLTVTAPTLIAPATRAGIYLWRGASGLPSSAQLVRQGFTPDGSRTLTFDPTYAGDAPGDPPTDAPWPMGGPARVLSEGETITGPVWDLEGDGSGVAGPFAWDELGNTLNALKIRRTSANQGIGTAWTTVILDAIEYDYGGPALEARLASNGILIKVTGLYECKAYVTWGNGAAGRRGLRLVWDNVNNIITSYDTAAQANIGANYPIAGEASLPAGAMVYLTAIQAGQTSLNIDNTFAAAWLSVRRIG